VSVRTSDHTLEKQGAVEEFAAVYFKAMRGITQQQPWARPDIVVLEFFGGDGRPDGSTAIFDRRLHALDLRHRLLVFERNPTCARLLRQFPCPDLRLFPGACGERIDEALVFLPELPSGQKQFGLVYIDPNNGRIPVTITQSVIWRQGYDRVDVLIHVATRVARRIQGAGIMRAGLDADIRALGKRHRLVRYFGSSNHDWALVCATNWPNPAKLAGYLDIDNDPRGHDLWQRLTTTQVARDTERQQRLVYPPNNPIGHTLNISDTHGFSPSAPSCSAGRAGAASAAE
jgi:hypothetical protein